MICIEDKTFKQIRDFIYELTGIFIPDTKKYFIENRLSKRLQENGLKSFEEYIDFLRYSSNGSELARLMDSITTNETYFFREPNQLNLLVEKIMPQMLANRKTKDLRIWSAACSTGEEPYSISILLRDKTALKAELIGSDISASALESARRAVYNSYSVRNVPEQYLKRYFKPNGHSYELDPCIKNSVRFMKINLIDDKDLRLVKNVDVIFCRNVLIYFDNASKHKCISALYDRLSDGGYLFIGTSETLHNITRAFKPVVMDKVVVYQKI